MWKHVSGKLTLSESPEILSKQRAVLISSTLVYDIPCPSLFNVYISSTLPVNTFTADGSRMYLGGTCVPSLTA